MAHRKRKHSEISQITTQDPKTITSPPTRSFRLLDLAAELRNNIYEKVFQGEVIKLRRSPRLERSSRLLAKQVRSATTWQQYLTLPKKLSSLALVNKQVHQEVTHLALTMLDIHTKVQNFDFAHIVTFLNKLDQHELDVLASNTSTQLMQIHIVYGIPERNRLTRWINRKKATTKKGSNIDFNYHPAVPAHEYYWEEQQRKARRMDMIALAKEVLKEKPDDQHYQQEGRRILQALEQG